ncbi:receptor-like protein kinase 5 [Pyrus ussuriensis x Pyrus communis]|uniref:Receptor-like protein kinase 5 n=1 Tax=Pyrus ussuriensis x Pyrus communis TaxID=2448454 RepID=A0A5N5FJM4_9ROSA|nr:receptor-like protein kinase 5 [Pyrus ussuriensis x Pyrus communis]
MLMKMTTRKMVRMGSGRGRIASAGYRLEELHLPLCLLLFIYEEEQEREVVAVPDLNGIRGGGGGGGTRFEKDRGWCVSPGTGLLGLEICVCIFLF